MRCGRSDLPKSAAVPATVTDERDIHLSFCHPTGAANAAIWKDTADFDAKRADLARASAGYGDIAAQGDLEAIKAATPAIGKTCKTCHDTYRDKDQS